MSGTCDTKIERVLSAGSFLGTGWAFPPSFAAEGAQIETVSGPEDVHQSLKILLATQLGERIMRETFGADLSMLVFEEFDQSLINRASSLISVAIDRHERRVEVLGVDVTRDQTEPYLLSIKLTYAIRGTNSRYNMVYPFFLCEGTMPGE